MTCNCTRIESLKKIYRKRGKKLDAALSDLKALVSVPRELETCKQQAATVSQELEVCKQQNARLREDLYRLVLGISTAQPQQPMLAFRNSNVVVCNYQVSTPNAINRLLWSLLESVINKIKPALNAINRLLWSLLESVINKIKPHMPTCIWVMFLKFEVFLGTGQGPALLWQQGSCPSTNTR